METKLVCLKCGHTWLSRVDHPASCPRCKSYTWDQPRKLGKKEEEK